MSLSNRGKQYAVVAQLVERVHGKDEVTSSILVNGSHKTKNKSPELISRDFFVLYLN